MSNPIDKNKSYTNKDFNSIYTELLDMIPTLTNKWNPTNEADPGVVLVKLMAVLGDKLNYNIDKSVLECFPGSVTQRKNARQLYNLIGYRMKWYQSAVGTIGIKLKAATPEDIVIPAFTTITNTENTIAYTTLSKVVLEAGDTSTLHYVQVIEGQISTVTDGSETDAEYQFDIDLTNLVEDNRYYFTDINVAENGIFVSDGGSDNYDWEQVDNVLAYPKGKKVYEFNVSDDETSCYIKFPENVGDLTNGVKSIRIKYITSLGVSGNILANTLKNFSNSIVGSDGTVYDTYIVISQPNAITNGKDPESIEDAYKSAKMTVGTFDTLVTKQDFYNYIRQLKYEGNPIISNLVVSDREDDINNARDLIVWENGVEVVKHSNGRMTPYNLSLHMLDYDGTYEGGFTAVTGADKLNLIDSELDDSKAINLDLVLPNGLDSHIYYLFKAKFKVRGELITSVKLTEDEAKELQENIVERLKVIYSSTNLEFGQAIDYQELVDNITNMDSRIKAALIKPLEYDIYKVSKASDTTTEEIPLTDDDRKFLVALMVERGNIQYYNFDDSIKYEFGKVGTTIEDIKTIKTTFNTILNSTSNDGLLLLPGEIVNLYAPQYITDTEYGVGCKVTVIFKSGATADKLIAGKDYTVGDSTVESVSIYWLDSDGVGHNAVLASGTPFKCTADLKDKTEKLITTNNKFITYKLNKKTVSANTRLLSVDFDESRLNATTKEFTLQSGQEVVLGINESIMYTDNLTTEIVRLGNGVKLKNSGTTNIVFKNGVSGDSSWDSVYGKLSADLDTINLNIVTANGGCKVKLKSQANSTIELIDGVEKTLTDAQTIIIESNNGTYEYSKNIGGDSYKIFTRFDLSYLGLPITLDRTTVKTGKVRQEIEFEVGSALTKVSVAKPIIEFNKTLLVVGGAKQKISETLNAFNYEAVNDTLSNVDYAEGVYKFKNSGNLTLHFRFGGSYRGVTKFLLPMTISELQSGKKVTVTLDGQVDYTANGNYIIEIPNSATQFSDFLKISTNGTANVCIGKLSAVTGVNTDGLGITDTTAIKAHIDGWNYNGTNEKFNYTHRVSKVNSSNNPMLPENMFDDNNICSRFTIAQYDPTPDAGNEFNIVVNKYSIKE